MEQGEDVVDFFESDTDEERLQQIKQMEFYTLNAIRAGFFLGGPLAGGYQISQNFKQLGEHEKARQALWVCVIVMIVISGVLMFIPESVVERISGPIIPLAIMGAGYGYAYVSQGKQIERYRKRGAAKVGVLKNIGVIMAGMAINLLYIILLIL